MAHGALSVCLGAKGHQQARVTLKLRTPVDNISRIVRSRSCVAGADVLVRRRLRDQYFLLHSLPLLQNDDELLASDVSSFEQGNQLLRSELVETFQLGRVHSFLIPIELER